MSRIGFFSFLGAGHLYPATALGRVLASRGHEVTFFHVTSAKAAVSASGLKFCSIEEPDRPFRVPAQRWGRRQRKWDETLEALVSNAERVLRRGPDAVGAARIDGLVVDQYDLAAGSVAELLGIPFINICGIPLLYLDDVVPPTFFGWRHSSSRLARLRNRLGSAMVGEVVRPVLQVVNEQRRAWRRTEFRRLDDAFSKLGLITRLPRALDFPRTNSPPNLFYAGFFHDHQRRHPIGFPWDRLNGKPIVYASMGTIRNGSLGLFQTIAEASSSFGVQLVLSLGGGLLPETIGALPGDPIVVYYAPQLELLKRASLVITHAGLNTTIEALSCAVPLVAIPIADDQPGVAARIRAAGVGRAIPFRRLSVPRLREAIGQVLGDGCYRQAALNMQRAIREAKGLERAADLIEQRLCDTVRRSQLFSGALEPAG